MATKTDSELNPGEADYKNKTDFNPNRPKNLDEMDENDVARGLNDLENHANTPSDANSVKDQEESSNFINNTTGKRSGSGFRGFFKGKGKGILPGTGAMALFLTLGVGGSLLAVPASILTMMEGSLTSSRSDAHRVDTVMHGAFMGGLFKKRPPGDGKGINKIGLMTDSAKTNMEKKGFTFDATQDKDSKKWSVKSMKFPGKNGATVTTAKEFRAAVRTPTGLRAMFTVSNSETRTYRDKTMGKILEKFKIDKSKILKSSNDKDKKKRTEAINKSYDENAKTSGDSKGRLAKLKAFKTDLLNKVPGSVKISAKSANIASAALAVACTSYNVVRATVATVKAKWYYDIINAAFPFVQAASQIRDQGNITADVVENLADRLTWWNPDKSYADYGQSALDSYGMQQAIYGNFGALGEIAEKYSAGTIGAAVAGNTLVKNIQAKFGKENIHTVCGLNSTYQTLSSVFCLAGPVAFAVCGGVIVGLTVAGDDILRFVTEKIADDAVRLIAIANLGSDLKGKPLGDAIAAGIGLMLMHNSMGSGVQPAKKGTSGIKQMKTMFQKTAFVDEMDTAIAKMQAKDNQFDTTNKYSFLGSLASTLRPYGQTDKTIFGSAINIFATLSSSFNTVSTSAANAAGVDQPAQIGERQGLIEDNANNCKDSDMTEAGLACYWDGGYVGVWSEKNLSRGISQMNGDDDVTYNIAKEMQANGFIDEELKYKDGSAYAKWREYCGVDRADPPGTTSKSYDDGDREDQRWFTMEKCADDDQGCGSKDEGGDGKTPCIDDFRYWYNYCERTYPDFNNTENCWSDTEEATPTDSEGWECPIDKNKAGAVQTQKPHDVGNGTASGIDYNYGPNTPIGPPSEIRAVANGEVIEAGPASGYGSWIRIKHNIDGKEVISYYGHMRAQDLKVKSGHVSKGQVIAYIGNEGRSTGAHVHVGLEYKDHTTTEQDYQNTIMKACQGVAIAG